MSNTLLPCPFCGGEAIPCSTGNHFATEKFFVSCGVCGVETPRIARTRKEAIAAWNHRTQPENEPLTLDELRQMDGEPVWVVVLEDVGRNPPYWAIVDTANGRRSRGARLISHIDDDFGAYKLHRETWLAYRNKPVKEEHHETDRSN